MKRNLRVGEEYALSRHKLNQFKIRCISLLAVLTSMCLYAVKQVSAQGAEPAATAVADIKPLRIGDTIPEALWQLSLQMVNDSGKMKTVPLSAYRDKLLLIDFWATWCSPCISSLKKLESLNNNGERSLAVLPTTYEGKEKVHSILIKDQLHLPSVINDTVLHQAFPHQIIPHVIWIFNNRVQAVTGSNLVTDSAITHLLVNGDITLPEKYELRESTAKNHTENNDVNLLYQSQLTGYQHGLNNKHNRISQAQGEVYITNKPIWNLFAQAVRSKVTYGTKTVFELADSLKNYLITPADLSPLQQEAWLRGNTYCYRLNLSPHLVNDSIPEIMFNELNRIFGRSHGVNAKVENRMTECYVLRCTDSGAAGAIKSIGSEPLIAIQADGLQILNHPIAMLRATLAYRNRDLPLVDATGIEYPVDIQLEADLSDITSVNIALQRYGLKIVKQYHAIPVLVIFSI